MNYIAWKFWIDIAQLLGLVLLGAYTWWSNNKKHDRKRFNQVNSRINDIEGSVKDIEHSVESMGETIASRPPCLHHDEFDTRLRKVQQGVSNIDGRMVGIGNSLDLIQTHLMNGRNGQ